jgi:peptidyl-prolyl cis-trans isomerase D
VSRQDAIEAYTRANSFADIRYVRYPYAEVTDEQITVSEEEIAAFYRENKDLFAQEASYDLSYVSFPVLATAEDTARTFEEVEALREEFRATENDSVFLARVQSEIPYNSAYVAVEDLREEYQLVTDLRVGEVSEVVEIFGNPFVFKKTGQRRGEVQFAILTYRVIADPLTTVDVVAEQAADFHFYAETEGLEEEAARQGLEVQTSFYVKDSQFAPGIGQSVQLNVVTAALDEGDLSDVLELPGQFIVVRLDKAYPAGTRPLNEVRVQIENRLRQEKRSDVAAEQLASALSAAGGELQAVAAQLGTVVGEATNIRMDGSVITGLGREPILIGAISEMEQGARSNVLSGAGAAYVVEVTDKSTIDPAGISEAELQQTRFRLQQERGLALSQVLFQELEKEAKIKDYRSLLLQ